MATPEITSKEEKMLNAQLEMRQISLTLKVAPYITKGGAALLFFNLVIWLFFPQYPHILAYGLAQFLPIGSSLAYPWLYHHGHNRVGIYLLLGSLILVITLVPLMMPQTVLVAAIAFICLIILGTLLLSQRGFTALLALSVLGLALDIILINAGWTQPAYTLPLQLELVVQYAINPTALIVLGLIIQLLMKNHDQVFSRLLIANLEVERRAAVEQEQLNRLEIAHQEIELRATIEAERRELLQAILTQAQFAGQNLDQAIVEILSTTSQQTTGASEQSAAIRETAVTIERVKDIAHQASMLAYKMVSNSQESAKVSQEGLQAVKNAIESMCLIRDRVDSIAENILILSEQTQQIGEIIATVNRLAVQSNLLALNASIEAVHAGEHGQGFAVVANEVSSLAEQSKQATIKIKKILTEIQQTTNATVMATAEGAHQVEEGIVLVNEAQNTIEQLSEIIAESVQRAARTTIGGQQQVAGIEQIAVAMESISVATRHNLYSTQQAEKSTQDLHALARSWNEMVAQYQGTD